MPKTKLMIVSTVPAPAVTSTFNGNSVEQVAAFKYFGLHFHQSGSIAHLVTPVQSRAGGSWAAVQRRHSLLQCGNTINSAVAGYPGAYFTIWVSGLGYA